MTIKKLKVPWNYLLILTLLLRSFFQSIASVTITFTAFTKKYLQFLFKFMAGSLIVNLTLLGKCGLRKISFHNR